MKLLIRLGILACVAMLFGQTSEFTPDDQKIIDQEIALRKKGDQTQLEAIPEKYAGLKDVSIVYEGYEGYYLKCRIINNSEKSISYIGYGISNPLCRIQIKDKDAWIEPKQGGICGTGLGKSELPPGKSVAFQISKGETRHFRIGIDLLPESSHLTVWSEK